MGIGASLDPLVRKPSEFYLHCYNGNYPQAKEMLSKLTYEQLNQIEPNGSTALHAATCNDHLDVVKLLLDNGCSRTVVDRNKKTAYEVAETDAMRMLFHRPTSNRFIDDTNPKSFTLLSNKNDDDKKGVPDDWLKGHLSVEDVEESQVMHAVAHSSFPFKKLFLRQVERNSRQSLKELIDKKVKKTERMYSRAQDLYTKFCDTKNPECLLTLYTLQTPIYGTLQQEVHAYATLLYLHLSQLKARAYQGYTYRGCKMIDADIAAYQWALNDQSRLLETRTVQSTSKNKSMAQGFVAHPPQYPWHSVLLIFYFPDHCDTAIDLTQISPNLPCISEFPPEEEVTLLPFTLFTVHDVKVDSVNGQYRITLKNVPIPKASLVKMALTS